MHITKVEITSFEQEARIEELELLLNQPTSKEKRLCSFCTLLCETCGSTKCTCQCSPNCKQAAKEMSSEPDRYPIDPLILPLVFHLNALRVIQTCWSCQGHEDQSLESGQLWKLPQVWFYSKSVVYPQLINEYLDDLAYCKRLNHAWQVSLCYSDDPCGTCFAIVPNLCRIESVGLCALQEDIQEISMSLVNGVRSNAKYLLNKLKYSKGAWRRY